MLQSIRDKSQGWFAWTIVIAICLTFALWGVHSYLYSDQAQSVVAKVNGTKITQQMVSSSYNQLRRQELIRTGHNSYSQQSTDMLKKAALQSLISNIVLHESATKDGFRVGPGLVEAALAKIPLFQVNGVFSKARFEQVVSGMLFSPDEFLENLQTNILMNQYQSGIVATSVALPSEVLQTIQLINQRRSFGYMVLPLQRFMAQVKLSPNAVKDYYHKNQDEFKNPELVSIQYLHLSVANLMNKIHPTEDQLKQFYQNNIASYTEPKKYLFENILISVSPTASKSDTAKAKKLINQIADKIKEGGDFNALVKQYSQDDSSVANDGKMPWMIQAQMDDGLKNVLKNLNHPGDVSVPIQVARGFEIVKLVELKPKKILGYDSVHDKVAQAYKQQHAEQQFSALSDQLANITYEDPDTLVKASKELNLPIESTGLFTKEGGKSEILKNPKIVKAAFEDDVLNQGNNSEPVNLSDDSVVVLRVNKHIPAAVKRLSVVSANIEHKLIQQAAEAQIQKVGNQIVKLLESGQAPEGIASKYNVTWQTVNQVAQSSKQVNPEIIAAAFKIAPAAKQGGVNYSGTSLSSGDFAIIGLSHLEKGSVENISKRQLKEFYKGTENNLGLAEYQLYSEGLINSAKIVHEDQSSENN